MALEDFRTYTEVDADADITVTQTKCDVSSMRRDADSHVYKDMGVGHFGDFEHKFTMRCSAHQLSSSSGVWGLSNGAHTIGDKYTADVGLMVYCYDSSNQITVNLQDAGTALNARQNIVVNTTYYCTVDRSGTTLRLRIYSDAARTTLKWTLSGVCVNTTFRYIEAVQSRESADADAANTISAYVEDLDLQEPALGYAHSFGVII